VMNGDILTTMDYNKMLEFHSKKKACATIGVHERNEKIDYGVITSDGDSSMEDYVEKPTIPFLVSMGINILNKKCISYIKDDEAIGMPELMLRLKSNAEKVFCYKEKCEWLDIGRPRDYELAQKEMEKRPERYVND